LEAVFVVVFVVCFVPVGVASVFVVCVVVVVGVFTVFFVVAGWELCAITREPQAISTIMTA